MVWSKSRTQGTCQGELGIVLQRELAPDFKWNWLQVPPKSWCVFRILPKDLGASGEWGSELWTDHERHLLHWNFENGWMVCQGCSLNGRVQHVIDRTATPTRQCTPALIFFLLHRRCGYRHRRALVSASSSSSSSSSTTSTRRITSPLSSQYVSQASTFQTFSLSTSVNACGSSHISQSLVSDEGPWISMRWRLGCRIAMT